MEEYRKKFIDEAFEHINDLEDALLKLENDYSNKSLIERVFRAMHSLKGGGAMFGFDKVSDFTHHLEDIYDKVRNDEKTLSEELFTITLKSIDHLKTLFGDDSEDDSIQLTHKTLLHSIKAISNIDGINDSTSIEKDVAAINGGSVNSYYIYFEPFKDTLSRGSNPLYQIEDICDLGKSMVFPFTGKIPSFDDLEVDKCYFAWEIILVTDKTYNDIEDVFIFVADDCNLEIHKISDGNVLENDSIIGAFQKEHTPDALIGLEKILSAVRIHDMNIVLSSGKSDKHKSTSNKKAITSIRVSSDKLDDLMNLVSELVTTQASLSLYAEEAGVPELDTIAENVQKLTRELRDNTFSIVLIPIETIITRFQRLVRDLSNELGKKIIFDVNGLETELDKTIIENLTDPLMHILRNSIDHGIETPKERLAKGKSEEGHIYFNAYHYGSNVYIQINDDGRGFSKEKIKQKALERQLISPDKVLTDKDIFDLVFESGFSTANEVTDVSGRGVGMDVVKKKINEIRGEVTVESTEFMGTSITIKLPLTMSIIDGLLVNINDVFYIIPLSVIDKIIVIKQDKLNDAYNNVLPIDGEQISFFNLRKEFNLPSIDQENEELVIVRYDDNKVGLTVDSVVGEYQAVLKPLGKYFSNQDIVSGATILGDGTVALVMDTNKAIKSFVKKYELT